MPVPPKQVVVLQIHGLKPLLAKLSPAQVDAVLRAGVQGGTGKLRDGIKRYPPKTEANMPRNYNSVYSISTRRPNNMWYVRGYGSYWRRRDGTIGRSRTSEKLGASWTQKVVKQLKAWKGIVGTNVSYARYVQDEDLQRWFHGARGWKTAQTIIKEKTPEIMALFRSLVNRRLGRP